MDTAGVFSPSLTGGTPEHRPTVLYVDDDEADIDLFRMAVDAEAEGTADVVAFNDADKALDHFQHISDEPDLIVLDLNLPKMDGLTLLEKLREIPALRRTPVVMLSNSDDPAFMLDAREAGAAGYFVKPLDYQRYTKMIRGILSVPDRVASHRKTFMHH